MPAARLSVLIVCAIVLASAQLSVGGTTLHLGKTPLGCAGRLAAPVADWSCPPFAPAATMGLDTYLRGHGLGLALVGPHVGPAANVPSHAGTAMRFGGYAAEDGGWAKVLPPAFCGIPGCMLELLSAPPARPEGLLLGTLSPVLLGCLAVLGALGIRPRA